MTQLTEDQVIDFLSTWLSKKGWKKSEMSTGHKKGLDLKVSRGREVMIIEAKGSKANPKAYNKTRDRFDSGQVKDHFGKALVKVLEQHNQHPEWTVGIAQPDEPYIRKCLQYVVREARKIGILLFWVKSRNKVYTR
jgi:hypothetical protein